MIGGVPFCSSTSDRRSSRRARSGPRRPCHAKSNCCTPRPLDRDRWSAPSSWVASWCGTCGDAAFVSAIHVIEHGPFQRVYGCCGPETRKLVRLTAAAPAARATARPRSSQTPSGRKRGRSPARHRSATDWTSGSIPCPVSTSNRSPLPHRPHRHRVKLLGERHDFGSGVDQQAAMEAPAGGFAQDA